MFLPSWNKDVLDRSVARALRGRPHPPVVRIPECSRGPSRDRLAPLLRLVPRRRRSRARVARAAAAGRFVTEFGAQAVPETAAFMEPERWPHLDWERARAPPRVEPEVFDRSCRPPPRVVRGVARRDAGVPGRPDPAAGRGSPAAASSDPPGGFALLLRRRAPLGHLVGSSTTPGCRRRGTARSATRAGRAPDARAPPGLVHVVSERRDAARAAPWSGGGGRSGTPSPGDIDAARRGVRRAGRDQRCGRRRRRVSSTRHQARSRIATRSSCCEAGRALEAAS